MYYALYCKDVNKEIQTDMQAEPESLAYRGIFLHTMHESDPTNYHSII